MKKAKPQTAGVPVLSELVALVGENVRVVSRFAGAAKTLDARLVDVLSPLASAKGAGVQLESVNPRTANRHKPFVVQERVAGVLVERVKYKEVTTTENDKYHVPLTGLVSIQPIMANGKTDCSRGWSSEARDDAS